MMKIRPWLFYAALAFVAGCGGDPETAETAPAATSAEANQIAALQARLTDLQARKQRIEDSNAIKRLQRAYGYYMEEALWDEVLQLFADDATFEFGRDGVYIGKQRIREYLYALNDGMQGLREGQLQEHLELMPVLTMDDDGMRAKARWNTIMLLGTHGSDAMWGEGPYENEYVKQDGVWKISKLRWFQTILVPYEGGWAKHEDVNKGIWVSDTLPADAPPTAPYGSWPETFLPPFSFPNPVARYVPPATPAASEAPAANQTPAENATPAANAGAQQ
jgi:hypothetical protein